MTSSPETPKARPILFSAPMIRALIDGQKTQTRRIIKPQPLLVGETFTWPADGKESKASWWKEISPDNCMPRFCPYGQPSDLLWVRETFQIEPSGYGPTRVYYPANDQDMHVDHSGKPDLIAQADRLWTRPDVYRPSIHIPRWASRLTLELTGVRVERLNDISADDCRAEGALFKEAIYWPPAAVSTYQDLWESINGKGSWESNPFVWVLSFRVHQQNIDAFLDHRRDA